MGIVLQFPVLRPLPESFEYGETSEEQIRAAWREHKGWWRSNGADACEECPGIGRIPNGLPMYLTGEAGVVLCEGHAPVKSPRRVRR